MSRVLVTGAAGFVGGNLVRELVDRGRVVRAAQYRDLRALDGLEVELAPLDVLDIDSLDRAMEGVDVVYHLAARIGIDGRDHDELRRLNVEGTANVVEACLRAGVRRLVHFSSIHALAYDPKDEPVDERRKLAIGDRYLAYDQSKAMGEERVLAGVERGLDAVILNPVGILGPLDFKPSPVGETLLQLHHREIPGLIKAGFYWVDVRDVVDGAIAAEERGRRGERYILAGEYATVEALARHVQAATGARPPRLVSPVWVAKMAAPVVTLFARTMGRRPLFTSESVQILTCHQQLVTEKAARELEFRPRPLSETVSDALEWFSRNGRFK